MATASKERPAYVFPHRRLKLAMSDPEKDPLVLVACGTAKYIHSNRVTTDGHIGAFSPITFLHLRMFEMAHDHVKSNTGFEVVGSEYISFAKMDDVINAD